MAAAGMDFSPNICKCHSPFVRSELTSMSGSRNRSAARTVASAENIPLSGRRELLAMLGLLDETHRGITPDPPEDAPAVDLVPLNGAKGDMMPTQSRLTSMYEVPRNHYVHLLPPGLRVMPTPEQIQAQAKAEAKAKAQAEPRVPKAAAPRPARRNGALLPPTPAPQCGQSLGGRSRHVRLGEALCDACRDYFNAYQRAQAAQQKTTPKRASNGRPRPACGSRTGARAHRIRGEEVCAPCLEAGRAAGREEWRRRKSDERARINARRNARRAERRAVEADIAAEQGPKEAAS